MPRLAETEFDPVAEKERERAKGDLLYMACEILSYGRPRDPSRPYLFMDPSPGSPHRGLAEFIQSADERNVTESLDLEPRGFLKSTLGTVSYTIWQLARDPEQAILIICSTQDKALSFLSEIKDHLENNERLRALFPELWPHDRGPWQNDRIRIQGRTRPMNVPSVRVMGLEQGKAGGHYHRIICDDLHDEANSSTADQCSKVITAYQRFRPLLIDQRRGEIRVTGTRWNGGDLYGWLMERNAIAKEKEKPPPVMVRVTKLRKEDGTPEWPGMYDEEEIRRLKESMDPEVYYSQYENDPFTESQQIFKRSDIEKAFVAKEDCPLKEMIYFCAVDPAQATNRWNDYSAIVTWGVFRAQDARFGYLVTVVDVFREKVETGGLVDEMYRVHEAWKPIAISIEAQSCESIVKYCLREEGKKRGTVIPWRTVTRGGTSSSAVRGKQRIRKLEPYLRNGTLRFVRHARGIDALIRELQDYPRGAHDDAIDALADFPEISFSPTAPASLRRWKELDQTASNWDQVRRVYEQDDSDVPYGIVVGKR